MRNSYRLDKLVRDTAVAIMENDGVIVTWRTLDDDNEYIGAIRIKLAEEAAELKDAFSSEDSAKIEEELADVLEVFLTAQAVLSFNSMEEVNPFFASVWMLAVETIDSSIHRLKEICAEKRKTRGGFEGRKFVSTISCAVGSKWDMYCSKDPTKYLLIGA